MKKRLPLYGRNGFRVAATSFTKTEPRRAHHRLETPPDLSSISLTTISYSKASRIKSAAIGVAPKLDLKGQFSSCVPLWPN